MFSDVNDMNELRLLRTQKIKEGFRAEEVNAAFNRRKKEIGEAKKKFFQIPIVRLEPVVMPRFSYLAYLGSPAEAFVFQLTEKGVRF